jgi:cation-transporting ATPase 13A1
MFPCAQSLIFCGFLVLHCPPKPESQSVLSALSASGHTLQMLTGDALLTATHAAWALGLSTKPSLLLQMQNSDEGSSKASATSSNDPSDTSGARTGAMAPCSPRFEWRLWMADGTSSAPPAQPQSGDMQSFVRAFKALSQQYDLCIDGDGFTAIQSSGFLPAALPYLRVLARMSPAHKETALSTLRDLGIVTMMCGDGTNDVGALKRSAVGIALVSTSLVAPPPLPAIVEASAGEDGNASGKLRQRKGKSGTTPGMTPREKQQKQIQARLEQELAQRPSVKLGDASIAAAFTAKSASVSSCLDIITQGWHAPIVHSTARLELRLALRLTVRPRMAIRASAGRCTLVTTTQMFKILALNCLVSAYSLSVLHLRGVRMSDTQATASGLLTAALFLFVSFAKPLSKLAPYKPPASVLAPSVLLSVLGQFAVHLYTLATALVRGQYPANVTLFAARPVPVHADSYCPCTSSLCCVRSQELGEAAEAAVSEGRVIEADADFEPSLVNTIVYVLSSSMLLSTFAANYTGRPFMASLTSNKGLMGTLTLGALILTLLTSGSLPDLEAYLELVQYPDKPASDTGASLRSEILNLMAIDFGASFLIEKAIERASRLRFKS